MIIWLKAELQYWYFHRVDIMGKSNLTQSQTERFTHSFMSSPPVLVLHLRRVGRCWWRARLIRAPVSDARLLQCVWPRCSLVYFCWFSQLPCRTCQGGLFWCEQKKMWHESLTFGFWDSILNISDLYRNSHLEFHFYVENNWHGNLTFACLQD